MKQKIFALFLILCGLCLNLKAETQGDIVGRVLDDSGAPLVGATVQMVNAKGGVTTDKDGYFRIPYSKDGAVRVKVSFVGYQTQTFVLKADERKAISMCFVFSRMLQPSIRWWLPLPELRRL